MNNDCNKISNIEELIKKVTSDEFDKLNFNCLYSDVPRKCLEEPCILGVDEAGRGPVLGPMVYAVCFCSVNDIEVIKSIGCTDSKALTEKKREEIFGLINEKKDELGWAADVISPNFISNNMQKRVKYSLNEIAQNSTIQLIEGILRKNVEISEIYVDTIGPPEKYQAKLSKLFPQCKVVVEKKADSLYPVVGAASICAKVIRDTVVQKWKFPELISDPGDDFGTGYPGDPKTKQFLSENKDDVFGFPHLVRFSWSTAGKLLEDCVPVKWQVFVRLFVTHHFWKLIFPEEDEEATGAENKDISTFFKPLGPFGETKHTPKFSFFKERSLSSLQSL